MIKRIFSNNSDFIKASLAYVMAHVIDYLLTVRSTLGTMLKDGNPMIRQYMDLFGTQNGLLSHARMPLAVHGDGWLLRGLGMKSPIQKYP